MFSWIKFEAFCESKRELLRMNVHILASNVLGCGQEHKGERACREDGAGWRVKTQPDEFDYLQVCVIMHRCFSAPCTHEHTHVVTRRTPSMQKTRHTRLKNKHTCFENLPTQNLPRVGVCAYVCLDSYEWSTWAGPSLQIQSCFVFGG